MIDWNRDRCSKLSIVTATGPGSNTGRFQFLGLNPPDSKQHHLIRHVTARCTGGTLSSTNDFGIFVAPAGLSLPAITAAGTDLQAFQTMYGMIQVSRWTTEIAPMGANGISSLSSEAIAEDVIVPNGSQLVAALAFNSSGGFNNAFTYWIQALLCIEDDC